MKFWDSSALVPLLVEEEATIPLRELYLNEPGTIVWWGTPVECASAVSRLEREERSQAFARGFDVIFAAAWPAGIHVAYSLAVVDGRSRMAYNRGRRLRHAIAF